MNIGSGGTTAQFNLSFSNNQLGFGGTDMFDGVDCVGNDYNTNIFHTSNHQCIR